MSRQVVGGRAAPAAEYRFPDKISGHPGQVGEGGEEKGGRAKGDKLSMTKGGQFEGNE
jgi:hypothetical protein